MRILSAGLGALIERQPAAGIQRFISLAALGKGVCG